MKIQCRKLARAQGTVLVTTLFLAALLGTFIYGYLNVVRSQNVLVVRAQAWNASLDLAEAGIEEGLAQLNPGAPLPTINRAGNGWGGPNGRFYGPVTRSLASGSYTVCITTSTLPTIYSTGTVVIASLPGPLTRVLRVTTMNLPMFSVGMAVLNNINFNGNSISTDSFNSSSTNLSTNGRYDPSKTSTNGSIASVGGDINVGNANVKGTVYLGPGATDSIKNNGVITGGVSNDFNVNFPDVLLPSGTPTALGAVSQIVGGVTYQYAISTSGYYSINNLSGNLYIAPGAQVTLLLNGNASPNTIVIGTDTNGVSGQLTIYMNGPSFTVGSSSSVDGGVPANLSYLGTTNNTSITFAGNASFIGTIYAPEANFTLGGGGSTVVYDFTGACVTKSITMNGHYSFHYDESLATSSAKGYVARSWQEL